jgi:hypothetical protein
VVSEEKKLSEIRYQRSGTEEKRTVTQRSQRSEHRGHRGRRKKGVKE